MTMRRIILIYGTIAGLILAISLGAAVMMSRYGDELGMAFGYLTMFIALSMVFVGVKRYRDEVLGGVIPFRTALALALGICAVGAVFYVLGWELYLFLTDYTFAADYTARYIQQQRDAGMSEAGLAALTAEMDGFLTLYRNPLMRMGITLTELAPVAAVVTVLSAAILRNPRILPARR